jgi:hypothetical protein
MSNHSTTKSQPVVTHHDQHTFTLDTRSFADSDAGDFTVTIAEMPGDNETHRNSNRIGFARYTAATRTAHHELSVHNVTKVETKRDDEGRWTQISVKTAQGETISINLFDNKS